jgi:hypothetical protein
MIKSAFKAKSFLDRVLEDPAKLKATIDKFAEQEKKFKLALRKLQEGKSFAKFKEECEAAKEESKGLVEEAEKSAAVILHLAKEASIEVDVSCKKRALHLDKRDYELTIREKKVESLEKDLKVTKDAYESERSKAKKEYDKALELKSEYTTKLKGLKDHLLGI